LDGYVPKKYILVPDYQLIYPSCQLSKQTEHNFCPTSSSNWLFLYGPIYKHHIIHTNVYEINEIVKGANLTIFFFETANLTILVTRCAKMSMRMQRQIFWLETF